MKSFIKTIALVVLLSGQFFVHGAEPVTGMFGFNLGDTSDSASAANRNVVTGGAVKYEVKPSSPHKSFQTYEVEVTTGSKKIHTITGTGRYPGKEAAMQVFNTVKAELEGKYGPAKTNRREGAAYFNAGQRSVSLLVNETRAAVAFLVLTCKDEDLTPMAEKEVVPIAPRTPATVSAPAATGEIDGAFGFKFGQVFDPATAVGVNKTTTGKTLYQVKPPTQNPSFNRYYVEVTPETKRIFEIWGIGPVPNENEGKIRRDTLVKAIESKYRTEKGFWDSDYSRVLMQGDRSITVKVSPASSGFGHVLEIGYRDKSLTKEGRGEAVDKNIKNLDSKGL